MKTGFLWPAVVALFAAGIGAACSSPSTGTAAGPSLTCDTGTAIARCIIAPVPACAEYGPDWTMQEAQTDCQGNAQNGITATFTAGSSCAHTGPFLTGSCLAYSSGHLERIYAYEVFSGTAKGNCLGQGGTWCPLASSDAGAGAGADGGHDASSDASDSASDAADATVDGSMDAEPGEARADAAEPGGDASAGFDSAVDAAHDARAEAAAEASVDASFDASIEAAPDGAEVDGAAADEAAADGAVADDAAADSGDAADSP